MLDCVGGPTINHNYPEDLWHTRRVSSNRFAATAIVTAINVMVGLAGAIARAGDVHGETRLTAAARPTEGRTPRSRPKQRAPQGRQTEAIQKLGRSTRPCWHFNTGHRAAAPGIGAFTNSGWQVLPSPLLSGHRRSGERKRASERASTMENGVPIITASASPFRLVVRGDSDAWSATLDDINSRTYDYVKLHRLSTYFDAGIAPFSLGVCYDGTMILPATEAYRNRDTAFSKFNQTLAELLVGGIYCEAPQPDDLGYGSMSQEGYSRIMGRATGPSASVRNAARMKMSAA